MDESRRERKARERWEKEMLRRLKELDDLDRRYGLGASPTTYDTHGRHRARPPAGHRRRREVGPALPGMLIVFCLLVFVFFKSPTTTGERLRQFVDGLRGGADDSFAFVAKGPNTLPVGWDACEPIHYAVNPDGAPGDWKDLISDAVSEVEGASGFDFVSDGTTTDQSGDRRRLDPEDRPPVLIDWATPSEVPDLEGDTVGIGGSTAVTRNGETRFVTGSVVLDELEYARMSRAGEDRAAVLILSHELGHVLGLDHVDDPNQLMNPSYVGQRGFGDGDLAGFKVLRGMPCG